MVVHSNTIGVSGVHGPNLEGGDFATINLYYGTSATAISSGDTLEAVLLSGVHDANVYRDFTSNGVDTNLVVRGEKSHNGNWNEGCKLLVSSNSYQVRHNAAVNFNTTYEDLVIECSANHFIGYSHTPGDGAGDVSGSITLNRCLFRSSHPTATRGLITYADLHNTDPSGNVSALGRSVTNINNCVFETLAGTGYILSLAWTPNHRAMEVNINGSTFIDSRITISKSDESTLQYNINGLLFTLTTSWTGQAWANNTALTNTSSTINDMIVYTDYHTNMWLWAGSFTGTNITSGAAFNFDGTVTSGEVCFVGPSGPEGNYRLVAASGNLPIHYASNSDMGTADVSYKPRVQEASYRDAGAYQSDFSSLVTTKYIGASDSGHARNGDYATFPLWYGDRRSEIIYNNSTEEVVFIDGDHNPGQAAYYNGFNEVNFNLKFKAENPHKGEWDTSTARLLPQQQSSFFFYDQVVPVTYEDLVVIASGGDHFGYFNNNVTHLDGAVFEHKLEFNRCLLESDNGRKIFNHYANNCDKDSGGSVTKLGDSFVTFKNCVLNNADGVYPNWNMAYFGTPSFSTNCHVNSIGTTFIQNRFEGRYSSNTKFNYGTSGCLFYFDNPGVTLTNSIAGVLSENLTRNHVDYISTTTNSAISGTNVTTGATFNFDGTVTSGEVCFVGPSGSKGNYRLVSDNDNLAVKYVTNASPLSRDVTDGPRSGLTDAGAFQSISDRVLSATIGYSTSADAATFNIWAAIGTDGQSLPDQDRWNRLVLHGDTIRMIYEPGNYSSTADGIYIGRQSPDNTTYYNWLPVAVNWEIKGQKSHNGNWDEGAIFHLDGIVNLPFTRADSINRRDSVNGENWLFEDLVVINSDAAYIGLFDWQISTDRAIDDSLTINRCLLRGRRNSNGSSPIRLNCIQGAGDGSTGNFDKDSLGRKERIGSFTFNLTNSVVETNGRLIEMNSGRYNGDHIYNYEGSYIRAGRMGADRMFWITYYAPTQGYYADDGGNVGMNVKGCIIDNVPGADDNASMDDFFPNFTTSNATYRYINWSSTCVDNIFATPFSLNQVFSSTTNTLFDVSTTYDGTVTSGQVGFVDSGGVSAFKDYRLVADLDNLAVQYATNADLGKKDAAGTVRPGLTDAGAYQSISTNTYTDKIGASADYDTLSLWHGASGANILNGDSFNLQFLSGAHDIGGTYNNFNEVDFDIILQAHPSALHNGDWNAGASIDLLSDNCFMQYFGDQTLSITFEDLLFKYTQGSRQFFLGHLNSTSGSCAQFSSTVTLNRCMLTHTSSIVNTPREFISYYIGFEDVDASGNVSALGKNTLNVNNCVVVGSRGYKFLTYSNQDQAINLEFNVKGTTFDESVVFTNGILRTGGNTKDAIDSYFTANFEGTILPRNPLHYNSFRDGWGSATRAFTFTDYIYHRSQSEMEGYLDGGSTNPPTFTYNNASFNVPFNYDGTVTSGEVCYVGPSGHEGNFRLVPDLDNLPVRYIDTSKPSFLGRRDVAGEPRPGLMDAGAFQSISTNVSSFEIGASSAGHIKDGAYATVSLWYTNERDSLLNGDTVNLEFLSGAPHSIGGPYYDSFNEVNFNLKFKPASSAIHNGNWDEGVALDMSTGQFFLYTGDHSIKFEIEDLILSSVGWSTMYLRNPNATPSSCGAYSVDFKQNRCLLSMRANAQAAYGFETRDSLGNLTEVGNYSATVENCISDSDGDYFTYFNALHDHQCNVTYSFIGSTIWRRLGNQGYGLTRIGTNSAKGIDSTLTHNFKGLLSDFSLTHFNSFNSYANSQKKIYNVTDSILISYNLSATTQPYWSGTYNYHNFTDARFSGSFDGTVTNGQVNFVDNGGVTALRDFRLVPDADNLPVQYVEILDELPGRDITGYRKPRLSDAGAFQSISTSSTFDRVGTSSVTFTPDYASLTLWRNDIYDEPLLNGMTRVAVLADEVFTDNGRFGGGWTTDGPRRVHHSLTLSGVSRQDGNLNTGTVFLVDNANYGGNFFNVYVQSRSPTDVTFNMNDVVVSSTHASNNDFSFCYMVAGQAYFPNYNTSSDFGAYDLKSNFKNCIFVSNTSGTRLFSPIRHQSNLFVLDPDVDPSVAGFPDIIEVGGVDTAYDSCVFIGVNNSYGRDDIAGTVGIYAVYIPNTTYGTSATLSMSSCTCVNMISRLSRLFVHDNNFVGSMFYNDHTVLMTNGWNNLITNVNVTSSVAATRPAVYGPTWRESISKFEDCIFSHASSYIAFRNQGTDLPIDASSLINCSFKKYFDFDGIARAGRVSFENNYVSSVSASYDFLDNFSGASIAYSLRKLSQSYSGYCIKVRRTSDNSEIDVGFDSKGDLNTSAITDHCGAASGYVSVWYDQTSNSVDATQSTSANQPLIYDGTSIITENGKPALSFHESRDTRLTFDTDLFEGTYIDLFAVLAVDLDGIYGVTHLASEGDGTNLYWRTGGRRAFMYPADRFQVQGSSEDRFGINMQTERQCILELWSEPTKVRQRVNNIQRNQSQNRAPVAIPSGTRNYIIGARSGNYFYNMNGRYQEFIIFPEDQDTSRDAIFDNLNNHYEASPLYFTPRNQ